MIRLLGELYNYTAISSALIFCELYHVINAGHEIAADGVEVLSSSGSIATTSSTTTTTTAGDATAGAGASAGSASASSSVSFALPASALAPPTRPAVLGNSSSGVQFDPRVVSETDPAIEFYRVQMVVEMVRAW
jgi:hypothetical protein